MAEREMVGRGCKSEKETQRDTEGEKREKNERMRMQREKNHYGREREKNGKDCMNFSTRVEKLMEIFPWKILITSITGCTK